VRVRSFGTQRTEILGIKAVEKAFVALNWGPLNTSEIDIGTDLVLMARDARLFDLGLYVGAQVKSGPSQFAKPKKEGDAITGWWWYDPEPSKHLHAWASFPLPQLLILHDLEKNESYWVHVEPEHVKSTGKGAKILVPARNTIDQAHLEELLAVAGSVRGAVELEGSAWTPGRTLSALDQLRYALIVPRLIAPHPNAGKGEPLNPAQALALATQARISELRQFAETHEHVPSPSDALESDDFGWRLVGALVLWLHGGGNGALRAVASDASDPHVRVAAAVAATTALVSEGLPEEARLIIEGELERDEARPVDHAWLTAQHARLCLDLGDIGTARADAGQVLSIGATTPGDVTAAAIAGSAAIVLFNTASWQEQRVSTVVTAADTTASWWRAQITATGLEAVAERGFSAWARDRSVTIAAEDVANNRLLSAALLASNAADHGGWRHLSGLLGRDMLMRLDRRADPQQVEEALGTLRLAGAESAIKLAVQQVVATGPASAVTEAARQVDLERSTRTTLLADLSLLRYAADVLDSGTVESSVDWLIPRAADPSDLERRYGTYFLELRLVETLSQVARGAEPEQQTAVVEYLVTLPPYDKDNPGRQDALSQWWASLVQNLPSKAWTTERLRRLATRVDDLPPTLSFAIRRLLAQGDDDARGNLVEEVAAGSLYALEAFGNVTQLSADDAASAISGLSRHVGGIIKRAHNHTYGAGHDVGEALALLNAWHPSVAVWDPLYRLLEDPAVSDRDKSGALRLLAGHANRLPEEVRTRLKPIAATIAQKESPVEGFPLGDRTDARGVAALLEAALGALDDDDAASRVIMLLAGAPQDRQWAVHVAHRLGAAEYTGILVALTDDQDVAVRASAASALAVLARDDKGGPLAAAALLRAASEPGVLVPQEIAGALASAEELPPPAKKVLEQLRSHPSARVRTLARGDPSS
jgi:hypothetical protein